MRVAVIINPISGSSGRRSTSAAERSSLARQVLERRGVEHEVAITRARGHATELSSGFAARGFGLVIAWGGDGTANETAGPLVGAGTMFGLVPAGSGDGLARGLGLSSQPEAALTRALDGPVTAIDVGTCGDRHFLNIASVGFDGAVALAFNAGSRRGVVGYAKAVASLTFGYRPAVYDLTFRDEAITGPKFMIAFANAREFGNGLILSPDADVRDGLLNMIVVDDGWMPRQFWRARRLWFRRDRPAQGIRRELVQHAAIAGSELCCHVDGEAFVTHGRIEVGIRPAALQFSGI